MTIDIGDFVENSFLHPLRPDWTLRDGQRQKKCQNTIKMRKNLVFEFL
jgi:hypothetical protein